MLAGRERLWVSPPRGPGRPPTLPETPFTGRQVPSRAGPAKPSPHAPLRPYPAPANLPIAPANLPITPAAPCRPGSRGFQAALVSGASPPGGRGRGALLRPPPPGPGMAASGSPGPTPSPCLEETRRAPPPPASGGRRGENELTSGRSRRRRQRGESRGPRRSRHGGGYRSALRPIVSLPRGSRRSRALEPGSCPARHLLPPLWKQPPPPRAARPGPRLRATGPARLTGRCQPTPLRPRPPPSWGGPVGLFPAARARSSRVPAGRGGALPGLPGAGAVPPDARPEAASGTQREGGRARAALESQDLERGFEALHENDRLQLVSPGRSRDGRVSFLAQLLTSCQDLGHFFPMPHFLQFLHL